MNDWQVSGTFFWHSGVPFSVLSTPYAAMYNAIGELCPIGSSPPDCTPRGIVQGSGPQYASLVPGVDPYCRYCDLASTQPGTVQWLNPDAFISAVDPSTGASVGGGSPANCRVGTSGRNQFRGPGFFWSDMYLTKLIPLHNQITMRFDVQFFNIFNHPNFGLPSMVLAGVPGKPSTQTGFGALTYTTSPPPGLLGEGLGGDSSPRMIALQMKLEF